MKRLYGTTDPIEAELLRALLRDAGIESTLDTGNAPALGIDVMDEDAEAAVGVLARRFEKNDSEAREAEPEVPDASPRKFTLAWFAGLLGRKKPAP